MEERNFSQCLSSYPFKILYWYNFPYLCYTIITHSRNQILVPLSWTPCYRIHVVDAMRTLEACYECVLWGTPFGGIRWFLRSC